jgi:hypothetical protein
VSIALRRLVALALLALGLAGCERELVVNERFVPTTVGIVATTDWFEVDGAGTRRYGLADGRVIEVATMDLDPFNDPVPEGDLLLMGEDPSPWIIRAGRLGDDGCFVLGLRVVDRGASVEIEMDRRRGLFLVVPKAPGYDDYFTTSSGDVYDGGCLDELGREVGPGH